MIMATSNFFRIQGPHPALASTVLLPSPRLGNNLGALSNVRLITMMDGSRRTFIQRGDSGKTHRWDFLITSDKMEELMDFIQRYRAATLQVTWRGEVFIGKGTANPAEALGAGRAGGQPGGEAYRVTFELVEVAV